MCAKCEMPSKEGRNPPREQNPPFSSALLEEIYRSVANNESADRVKRVTVSVPGLRQGCREGIGSYSSSIKEKCRGSGFEVDHDVTYFSSTSISSDSSSGGFSSSDTESFHWAKTKTSCFAPLKLRPVKTPAVPAKMVKAERDGAGALFCKNREEGVESKSKALKDYETLKKVRQQPVSPGGRLTSLLNSIFQSSSKKKGRSHDDASPERKPKTGQASTCSSATSFSRACLNNGYSSRSTLRDETRDVVGTRSVRFCPLNFIVGEDRPGRPCRRTSQLNETEGGKDLGSVQFVGKNKNSGEPKNWRGEETRTWMQEITRLEDIKRRNEESQKGIEFSSHGDEDNDDDDDGAGSWSSSDLFEIDHLAMIRDDHDAVLPT